MANKIRARNRQAYDFQDGVKARSNFVAYTVNTLNDLKNLDVSKLVDKEVAETLGSVSLGDNLGDKYYWDASSNAAASNTVVVPTSNPATGRWIKVNKDGSHISLDDGSSGSLWTNLKGLVTYLRSSLGSSIIGFKQLGTSAISRSVQDELRDRRSVTQFGADSSGSIDSYPAFNAAPDGSFIPAGTYLLSASVINKTFVSYGNVILNGNGSANIKNLLEDWFAGFAAVDAGSYPNTSLEYKSEPSLVSTTSGKVFCFYRIGPNHQGTTGDTGYLVYRVYNKITKTWGAIQTLVARTGFDTRNQIAGVTSTGRIVIIYYQCEYIAPGTINSATRSTKYKYSDDDGLTWSTEFNLSQYCPYPSLDNVPFGKIISFSNGNLLISLYNYHTIFTLRSTDNGTTWGTTSGSLPNPNVNIATVYTTPTISDDNITEPTLVKISDTNLVCIARCITTGLVADGTVTWQFLGKKWLANTRYEKGMHSYISGNVYYCTVAGTTGTVAPSHTGGTATDGTVTWQHAGAYAAWVQNTAYSTTGQGGQPQCVETYSAYLYRIYISGTSGTSAPYYSKLGGEETQFAYFKSDNGGVSWGSAQYVTWTSNTYQVTTSPPKAIVRGDTLDLAWFSRSPEWSLYRVRMSARGFFENPAWAFSKIEGEPRNRLMRSFLAPTSDAYDWRIDCGYVDLVYLPWSDKIMAAWYDKPATNVAGKTTLYSTILV